MISDTSRTLETRKDNKFFLLLKERSNIRVQRERNVGTLTVPLLHGNIKKEGQIKIKYRNSWLYTISKTTNGLGVYIMLTTDLVDKIFHCMSEFYGERWDNTHKKEPFRSMVKVMWISGLKGCTYDEIKSVLIFLKKSAKNAYSLPPNHIEFHRYAKGYSWPPVDSSKTERGRERIECNPEIARAAIRQIKEQILKMNTP